MDRNKLIAAAAKKALAPLGLRRDGKSRLWYDDHGWWAIIVEFQPSGWSRGSYLNVGLCWMLYEQSHWSYCIGGREEGFKSADHEEQFEAAIEAMTAQAARCISEYRERFSSLAHMYAYYRDLKISGVGVKPASQGRGKTSHFSRAGCRYRLGFWRQA